MSESLAFLLSGVIFGLVSGLSPGPLLTLVISETLKYNKKEGMKIAIAPLLTDFPILLLTVIILSKLRYFNHLLGFISFIGALFLGYLAYENFTVKGISVELKKANAQSLKKGITANFLSPYPYLFWFTVGTPTLLKAYNTSILSAALFIIGFFFCLVGSKIIIAILAEKSKTILTSKSYIYIIRALAIILLFYAVLLIESGLNLFGIF